MTILTAVLFLKRRLLKIAKSPVLRTCGNDNSKSRYGNDLKFVMAFLDRSSSVSRRGLALTKSKKKLRNKEIKNKNTLITRKCLRETLHIYIVYLCS